MLEVTALGIDEENAVLGVDEEVGGEYGDSQDGGPAMMGDSLLVAL